jgi:hypothetical protein
MGWHYILTVKCKILPEYLDFIEKEYMRELYYKNEDTMEYLYGPEPDYYDSYDTSSGSETETVKSKRLTKKEKRNREIEEDEERELQLYNSLSKFYRDLIDIWKASKIGNCFYEYKLNKDEFNFQLSKKVITHNSDCNMNFNRDLKQDYEKILKDIIVPITSEIISCNVESDDFGDMIWYYSDSELRNIQFRLQDKIKG